MSSTSLRCQFLVVMIGAMFLGGCGGAPTPPLAPVSGRVSKNGAPVANANVTFAPVSKGRPSSATTASDGSFTLLYVANQPGATLGKHRVTIDYQLTASSNNPNAAPLPPPAPYLVPEEVEVVTGENSFQFTIP